MKQVYRYIVVVFLLINSIPFVTAQDTSSINFFKRIKLYDLSKLWCADSIQLQDDGGRKICFPEPLGYIGKNYQRFYIHYTSVKKNNQNPYVYDVCGKTRVKNIILNFKGTIKIIEARLNKESYLKPYKQGFVVCEVNFFENKSSFFEGKIEVDYGFFKGQLETDFCIDIKNKIQYDAIMAVADGYSNNQCSTTLKSYKTGKAIKCNWGDFRIPDSKKLDCGAGDVSINKKYIQFGWQSFVDRYSADKSKAKKAIEIEDAEWWK